MKYRSLFLALTTLLLSSCSISDYFTHRELAIRAESGSTSSSASSVSLSGTITLPKDTALIGPNLEIRNRIIDMIDTAKQHVYLSVYLLTDKTVIKALTDAKSRWIDTRVILEKEVYWIPNANRNSQNALASAGISIHSDANDGFNFTHAKYLLVDGNYVISTGNYAKTSFEENREWFLFGDNTEIREYLEKVFLGDFYEKTYKGTIPEGLYVSPEDSRSDIEKAINDAKKQVIIYAQSLSDEKLISLLVARKIAGADVRVCLAKVKKPSNQDLQIEDAFKKANIPFVRTSGPTLHAKTLVADNFLFIGSENFTRNSLDSNREIGRIFFLDWYEKMYRDTLNKDCKWQ